MAVVKWTRAMVADYGRALEKAFPGLRVSGQCRANSVRPPGGAANSLHYVRNGCRALDIDTKWASGSAQEDALLLRVEAWAKGTGVFQEVIYSQETRYHRTRGGNNHLHLGFPLSGDAPDPGSGFTPAAFGIGNPLDSLTTTLREFGTSVTAVVAGIVLFILGVWMIAKDQAVV